MRLFIVAAIALLPYGLQPAAAQTPTRTTAGIITSQDIVTGIISEIERRTIARYYQGDEYDDGYDYDDPGQGHGKKKAKKGKGKNKGLPPGLAKRDQLPPGLAKQLDERGALPPGLAKRDLPSDLESTLPRRIGERFYIVDENVVLVQQATGVVLDIIGNVVRAGRQGN